MEALREAVHVAGLCSGIQKYGHHQLPKIMILFPLPIIIALMLNELRNMVFKRTVQTVIYLPHFLSWVIVGGLFIDILSTNGGIVNKVLVSLGMEQIAFFLDNSVFRGVLITSAGWKETGWSTIVYLARLQ